MWLPADLKRRGVMVFLLVPMLAFQLPISRLRGLYVCGSNAATLPDPPPPPETSLLPRKQSGPDHTGTRRWMPICPISGCFGSVQTLVHPKGLGRAVDDFVAAQSTQAQTG